MTDRFSLKPHDYEPFDSILGSSVDTWKRIETRPTSDDYGPFLVLLPGNLVADYLIVQVSNFEGRMYPDGLEYLIDWENAITTATHWRPTLLPPTPETTAETEPDHAKTQEPA